MWQPESPLASVQVLVDALDETDVLAGHIVDHVLPGVTPDERSAVVLGRMLGAAMSVPDLHRWRGVTTPASLHPRLLEGVPLRIHPSGDRCGVHVRADVDARLDVVVFRRVT